MNKETINIDKYHRKNLKHNYIKKANKKILVDFIKMRV